MFVREPRDLNIAQLELTHQSFENNQCSRPSDSIVIEMRMRRQNDIDLRRWKIPKKPLRKRASRVVSPRVRQNAQTIRRRNLERIVTIKLNFDVTHAPGVAALFLNLDK
jgi:hypothetical protein